MTSSGESGAQLPKPGQVAIFNRSHYEDVLIAKVKGLYRDWAVTQILIETMEAMKLTYPKPRLNVRSLKKQINAAA